MIEKRTERCKAQKYEWWLQGHWCSSSWKYYLSASRHNMVDGSLLLADGSLVKNIQQILKQQPPGDVTRPAEEQFRRQFHCFSVTRRLVLVCPSYLTAVSRRHCCRAWLPVFRDPVVDKVSPVFVGTSFQMEGHGKSKLFTMIWPCDAPEQASMWNFSRGDKRENFFRNSVFLSAAVSPYKWNFDQWLQVCYLKQ